MTLLTTHNRHHGTELQDPKITEYDVSFCPKADMSNTERQCNRM